MTEAMPQVQERPLSPEDSALLEQDKSDLAAGEKTHGMEGALVGRVQFGLDPAAMMVVREAVPLSKKIIESLGTDEEHVWPLVKELHDSGPWKFADRLRDAGDNEIRSYIVLADICHESGWPGYAPAAYLEDRRRVMSELASFTPEQFAARKKALEDKVEGFEDLTTAVGGREARIAAASNDAAISVCARGFKGVVIRAGEMRFAQTLNIDDKLLEEAGLVRGYAEVYNPEKQGFDRVALDQAPAGARIVWVEASQAGQPVGEMVPAAKRIKPGYILTYKNEGLAVQLLAKAIVAQQEQSN